MKLLDIWKQSLGDDIPKERLLEGLGGEKILSNKVEGFLRYFIKHFILSVEIPDDCSDVLEDLIAIFNFMDYKDSDIEFKLDKFEPGLVGTSLYNATFIASSKFLEKKYKFSLTWNVDINMPKALAFGENLPDYVNQSYLQVIFYLSRDNIIEFLPYFHLPDNPIIRGTGKLRYAYFETYTNESNGGDIDELVPV